MQELLLATGRRKRLRVTAFGGIVSGLAVGAIAACAAGYVLRDRIVADANSLLMVTKSAFETKLSQQDSELNRLKPYMRCESVLQLVGMLESNAATTRARLSQFPAFKTEPYKGLFADLVDEAEKQEREAASLRQALTAEGVDISARCAVSPAGSTAPSLWARGGTSFTKDGWRGTSQ